MHLLTTAGKRLWDAAHAFVAVLFGHLTTRKLTATQRVKHAAALQNDLLEVASLLEKMHAWTSRMAARDSRAAKKILDDEGGELVTAPTAGSAAPLVAEDRKTALRRFVTARNFGFSATPPPPFVVASEGREAIEKILDDMNGDEPTDEENP